MGFYTYLGDKLDGCFPRTQKLKGEFNGKYVGGRELYHWCFKNDIKQLKIGYDESDLVFELTKENVEKAILDNAMEVNSNTVLKRLLEQMILYDIEVVYFYGDY